MFAPCGPRSAAAIPLARSGFTPPSPSPFLLPGSSNPLARSPGPPREPFSTFSGSAPSLQSPCFALQLSALRTRPGTQTVAPGLLGDSPPKIKGLGRLLERVRSPPTARMLQCWRSGPTRRRRGVRRPGKKGLLRDSAQFLRAGRSDRALRALPLFVSEGSFHAPPGPRPRGGM